MVKREIRVTRPEEGYASQKYEVRARDEMGIEFVVGWTSDKLGEPLVTEVEKHPHWYHPRVLEKKRSKY
jgi:hypothetical protein